MDLIDDDSFELAEQDDLVQGEESQGRQAQLALAVFLPRAHGGRHHALPGGPRAGRRRPNPAPRAGQGRLRPLQPAVWAAFSFTLKSSI